MSPELFAYPFLFIAIFFESFVLVTLLSKPARAARRREESAETPRVAIIVPCWNEAATIASTCASVLALDYPKDNLEIILVDDGSTDTTGAIMEQYRSHPQIKIIKKENGGKHTALNAGIAATQAELIGCLDADSFVEPESLREMIVCFSDPQVMAATAAMSIYKPTNMLEHMQNAEYTFGITLRHSLGSINSLYVTPGPFSFYRRSIIEQLGGFRYGHQTEDMEMALRIQQAGYKIDNTPYARVYTKAPDTIGKLIKQRTRWISGFLRNILGEYRGLIGSRRHSALGTLVLPTALLAIVSSMMLFFLMMYQLAQHLVTAVAVRAEIPLTYSLMPHSTFGWFYMPTNFYLFLAIIVVGTSVVLIAIGKRISKTGGSLTFGIISYVLLYGFIVPLWLMRATSDVALGIRRDWRF